MFVFNIIGRMNIIPGYDFTILNRTQNCLFWYIWFNGTLCSFQNRLSRLHHIVWNARDYLGWQLFFASQTIPCRDMGAAQQKIFFNAKAVAHVFHNLAIMFGDNFAQWLSAKANILKHSLSYVLPQDNITNSRAMLSTLYGIFPDINTLLKEIKQRIDLKPQVRVFVFNVLIIVLSFVFFFVLQHYQINKALTEGLNCEFSISNFLSDTVTYIFFYPLHLVCYVVFGLIPLYNFFEGQVLTINYDKFSLAVIYESIKGVNSDIFVKKMFDAYNAGAMSGHLFPKFATLLATFLIYIDGLFGFTVTKYLFFEDGVEPKKRLIGIFYFVLTVFDFLVLWLVYRVIHYNCVYLPMIKICVKNRASPQAFLFLIGGVLTLVLTIVIVLWFFGYIKL